MKVVISIHDVCNEHMAETGFLMEALRRFPKTFLVIPQWKNQTLNTELVTLLKDQDLAVHGLTHDTTATDPVGRLLLLSRSVKEFYRLDRQETLRRIRVARDHFEDAFGYSPEGFVPPMWYHNRYTKEVLKGLSFVYTESATGFYLLKEGKVIPSMPLCFDYGNNKLLNRFNIVGWKLLRHWRQTLVRISIHPSDISNGYWPAIEKLISWYEHQGALFVNNTTFISSLCYPSLSAP